MGTSESVGLWSLKVAALCDLERCGVWSSLRPRELKVCGGRYLWVMAIHAEIGVAYGELSPSAADLGPARTNCHTPWAG